MYLLLKIQMRNYSNIPHVVKTRLLDYLKKLFLEWLPLKKFQPMYKYSILVLSTKYKIEILIKLVKKVARF